MAGKVCILKTFFILTVYIMQILVIPDTVLKQVNRFVYRFLWRKRDCNRTAFDKVKRNVICSDLENVELNMTDWKQMQTAFLCCNGSDVFYRIWRSEKYTHIAKKSFAPLEAILVSFQVEKVVPLNGCNWLPLTFGALCQ